MLAPFPWAYPMVDQVFRFCSGNLRRSTLLFVLIPLGAVSYFGTLALAIFLFPKSYDWRYRVMSDLFSPHYNPAFYWIPSSGIVLSGLLILPFGGYIQRPLRLAAPRAASLGAAAFVMGAVALSAAGLAVSRNLEAPVVAGIPIWRIHELLGHTAGLGFGLGMVLFYWCLLKGHRLAPAGKRLFPRKLLVWWTLVMLPPLLGLALSEGLALMVRTQTPWSHAIHGALRHFALWQLGFWEWIGSMAMFLFLVSSALFLPEQGSLKESRRARPGSMGRYS